MNIYIHILCIIYYALLLMSIIIVQTVKDTKWRKNKIRKKMMLYNRLFEPERTTARCCVNAG